MNWILHSPNGKLKVDVGQKEGGSLYYEVEKHGKRLIEESALGIETSIGAFVKELCFVRQENKSIREEYSLPVGKKEIYVNHAEELALHFETHGASVTIRVRAFDDGMAFRYEINHPEKDSVLIEKEITQFWISKKCRGLWLQDWVSSYEGPYQKRTWEKSLNGQPFGMPCLFYNEDDGMWMMINEANLLNTKGSFCSCHLVGNESGCMTVGFAPEENGHPVRTALPFVSAWRYIVLADSLDELVNSTINYNLNPPAKLRDISWIRPGRALWSWWQDMNGAQLYLESKNYVDLAAAYGFEAVTLDCGWDPCWVKELCSYAHGKGVQIWIWTAMQRVDTPEKAGRLIPLWADWGVDGLKIDFFENDSQHTMEQYGMLAEMMEKYHLMINFHGSVKPMGEGRTWPHFMTAEGIMGLEHYQWSDRPDAVHNCTVPFTRNVAGPMDYTPVGFTNPNRNTTMGHQLALPVVFDSGVTNYALALRFMEGWKGTDFLRRTRNHYQGVRVLSGYPGDHAAILRYTEEEWLIGVITAPKKVVELSLAFLGKGEYEAEIYEDCAKGEMIAKTCRKVSAADTLRLSLLEAGGAGIYIRRKIEPLAEGICTGYMSSSYQEYPGKEAVLYGGSEPVKWEDGTEGFLLNGSAEISGVVENSRNYSLRFFYAAEKPWKLQLQCGNYEAEINMPESTSIRIFVTHEIVLPMQEGPFRLRMKRTGGKAPAVWKLKLLDNCPPFSVAYVPALENLKGGGEIVREAGRDTAVGLGEKAELCFSHVIVPKAGKYVLRIAYIGGESRDISIQTNGERVIDTYLHCSSGWEFPNWENVCEKELLVELERGENQIRLYNSHGKMSHIQKIELIAEKNL